MKTKVVENRLLAQSNVLVFSSEGSEIDFLNESVSVNLYFDGEQNPIEFNARQVIHESGQRFGTAFELPVMGDSVVIEIASHKEELLPFIQVEAAYRDPLTMHYGLLNNVIGTFKDSVGLHRIWQVDYNNRQGIMEAIYKESPAHHAMLHKWLETYVAVIHIQEDYRLRKKQYDLWKTNWEEAKNNLSVMTEAMQDFCRRKNIKLINIVLN